MMLMHRWLCKRGGQAVKIKTGLRRFFATTGTLTLAITITRVTGMDIGNITLEQAVKTAIAGCTFTIISFICYQILKEKYE